MKSLPVLLAIFLIFSSPTALSQSTDVLSILSFGFQPDNIVEKSAGNITIEVEVKNVSTSIVSTDVEFSENSDTLPTITSIEGIQSIPAGGTTTFTAQYDLTNAIEGNNYTVYARVSPAHKVRILEAKILAISLVSCISHSFSVCKFFGTNWLSRNTANHNFDSLLDFNEYKKNFDNLF